MFFLFFFKFQGRGGGGTSNMTVYIAKRSSMSKFDQSFWPIGQPLRYWYSASQLLACNIYTQRRSPNVRFSIRWTYLALSIETGYKQHSWEAIMAKQLGWNVQKKRRMAEVQNMTGQYLTQISVVINLKQSRGTCGSGRHIRPSFNHLKQTSTNNEAVYSDASFVWGYNSDTYNSGV